MTTAPLRLIIGLDPATHISGYAALAPRDGSGDGGLALVECGTAKVKDRPLPERLHEMFCDLGSTIDRLVSAAEGPARIVVGVEKGYVSERTRNNAIPLGAAFAVAVLAARSAETSLMPGVALEIVVVSPSEVKRAATGSGGSGKASVQMGVAARLGLPAGSVPPEDAADAIAVALAAARIGFTTETQRAQRKAAACGSDRRPKAPSPKVTKPSPAAEARRA